MTHTSIARLTFVAVAAVHLLFIPRLGAEQLPLDVAKATQSLRQQVRNISVTLQIFEGMADRETGEWSNYPEAEFLDLGIDTSARPRFDVYWHPKLSRWYNGSSNFREEYQRVVFDGKTVVTHREQYGPLGNPSNVDSVSISPGASARDALADSGYPFRELLLPTADVSDSDADIATVMNNYFPGAKPTVASDPETGMIVIRITDDLGSSGISVKNTIYVDQKAGFLIKRHIIESRNKDRVTWRKEIDAIESKHIQPGIWLPSKIKYRYWIGAKLYESQDITVTDIKLNAIDQFKARIPAGAAVHDSRILHDFAAPDTNSGIGSKCS